MSRPLFFKLLLLLSFSVTTCNAQVASKGKLQIKYLDTPSDKPANISGEWQIFYGRHLSANEMKALMPGEKHYVTIPSNWKKTPLDGKDLPVFGTATYYLQLLLPENKKKDRQIYGFRIGNITSAYKLWVNDEMIMQAGNATSGKQGFEPTYFPQTETFGSASDTLDVILHVSNFFDINYAGISQNIYFGKKASIENYTFDLNAMSIFLLSLLFILFFFQILIGLVQKEDRSHLMLALLSVIFLMKMSLDGDVLLFHFIPGISFLTGYRLWLCSFLCIPIVLRFTKISFPLDVNPVVEKVINLFFLLTACCFLTLNIQFLMSVIFYIIYVAFACIIYLFIVLIKAIKNHRNYSVIHLISFSVMILLFLNDLIYVTNQETTGYLSQLGACFYIVTQSIVASIKFARSHKKALKLSQELETTNQNLEKMVTDRTEELQDSNTKLAKLNKQKDFLISAISHDLRNSFNILINYSRILKEHTEDMKPEQQEIAKILYETSTKSYGIFENILSWTKLMITNYAENSVISCLSGLIEKNKRFFSEQLKNKSLTTDIEINDELKFHCDESHLDTILRNLLSNAIKFSRPDSVVSFWNRLDNGWVRITVHDEGIGFSKEMAETIFDSNKEKKRKGTAGEQGSGLGLLIVKELVESNHGTISCFCTPEQGTDFTVSFPLFEE